MRQTNVTIQKPPKRTILRRHKAVTGRIRSRHLLLETLEDRRMLAITSPPDEPLRTGTGPLEVRLGLLNADPYEDLAALNSDGSLTTAFNRGDDNWQSAQSTPLGLGVLQGMELVLLPGDTLADLAVQSPNAVTLLHNDGLGGWSPAQTLTSPIAGAFAPTDGGRVKLAAALLNDDGAFDLAVPSPGTGEVVVYWGTANGNFGAGAHYATGGSQPVAVAAGQFVGDSSPDLAVGHRDGTVTFFAGAADGSFTLLSGAMATGLGTITDLVAGDYNGDGEQDLVVSGGDRVTLLTNDPDPVSTPRLINGDFAQGLTGWTSEVLGQADGATLGAVSALGGVAQFRENESFLVSLQQTFVVPPTPQTVAFDLASLGLANPDGGIPDAFEASLLDANSNSVVSTIDSRATSFFNVNPGNVVSQATGVMFDGRHVTVDISTLTPGTAVTLVFDLVGNPPGDSSVAAVDNVVVSPSFVADNTFSATRLSGQFTSAAGIAQGDVDGDGQTDLVVADSSANQLVVYAGNGQGGFARNEYNLTAFGNGPAALAIAPLTAGDSVGDVAVAMTGSNLVLTPLGIDQIAPQASLVSPTSGQIAQGAVTQFVVQFSEGIADSGSTGQHSVTNPAAYRLYAPGPNGVFDGGSGDDILVPLDGVTYNANTLQASVQIAASAAPLADGPFQIRVAGNGGTLGLRDLAGNPLGDGTDFVASFGVNRLGPVNLTAAPLTGAEGQSLALAATFDNPGSSSPHSATIDWGDGSNQPVIVTFAAGHGQLTAQHAYPDNGSYTIHVQVSDDSLAGLVDPTVADTTATISNVAPTFTVSANRPVAAGVLVSLLVGTFTDPGFDNPALATHESFTATIDWGDGSSPSAGVVTVVQGSSGLLTTGQIVGTHTFATLGTYQVTVMVSDDDGGTSQGTFSVSTQHRFAVVDQSAHEMYTYDSGFNLLTNPDLGQYNSAPRGITTTASGDTFWVVDASRRIVVYDRSGTQLGQWNANEVTQPQGIATDGTNLWMVGAAHDSVYYYANGAALRSGTTVATSSFALAPANSKASDIVTDGQRFWVTDENTTPKVFVYSMTGTLLGSWTIDSQNVDPSGIALDSVTGTLWIVDRHTAKVYEYPGASSFTSGSHSAASQHSLAAGNINPEGITDPTIPINIGGPPVIDSISVPGEVDSFSFTATAGQSIFIDFQSLSGGTGEYFLRYAATSALIATGAQSFANGLDRGPVLLSAAGTYTFEMTGKFGTTPSYSFRLLNVPDPDVMTMQIGDTKDGAIESPGVVDEWRFTALAGQQVFVNVQQFTGNGTFFARILNSAGNSVDNWSGFNHGPITLSAADTYTLRINGTLNSTETFTYRFKLWNVPAPDVVTMQIGDVKDGEIQSPAAIDEWRFSATAGQKIYVDFQQFSGNATLNARILNSNGVTVDSWAQSGLSTLDRGPIVLPAADTYTLRISPNVNTPDTFTYRFQIWNIPPDNLQTIPTNTPISGHTFTPVERIVYSFTATAGQQYFFDAISNPQQVYFTLTAPNSSSNLFPTNSFGDVLLPAFTVSGTYTLIASSFEAGKITDRFGAFQFQMQEVASPTLGTRDSLGTNFWFAFPPVFRELADPQYYAILSSNQEASGTILAADGSFRQSFYIPAGESITVHLAVQGLARGVLGQGLNTQKALHIQSLQEISVYGEVNQPAGSEAFTALPVDALGTEHLVMSISGGDNRAASQLAVVATAGSTTVTITPSVTFATFTAGVPFTKNLEAGDAFQLDTSIGLSSSQVAKDLTGTIITANKPIVVYGGHQVINIPAVFGVTAFNPLVEQLPSTDTWGRRFVTVPLATRLNGDVFRYLAATNGTEVRVNGTLVATLNRGQFFEQNLTQASEIVASQPILVAQFSHSTSFDGQTGDPMMMLVPPYEQFLSDYEVATPTVGFNINYINVAVATSAVGTVSLDGNPISASLFSPIGSSGLSGAQIPVAPGGHRLLGPTPFGIFSYGFAPADAYGYPGGFNLSPVATVTQLSLSPHSATVAVGTLEALQATVTNQSGQPVAGVRVDFAVSGPNVTTGFAFTDALGHATFSYTGALPGTDTVTAGVGMITDSSSIFWSATPPSVVFSSPEAGSSHRSGSFVLVTGIAQVGIVGGHIAGVTINGHSVDSFDAAGHFFATVQIAAGANAFTVTATDSLGQTGQATLPLVGIAGSTGGFDFGQAQDVTAQAALTYAATTYNRRTNTLHTQALLTNAGRDPLRGPVLAVFDRIDPAAVTLASSEGTDPAGRPWIAFDTQLGPAGLAPSATSQAIDVRFANPDQHRFEPFVSLLAAGNLPPEFISLPVTVAVIGRTYTYAAAATDPNSDALTYRVLSGPANIVVNSSTGLISWTPTAEEAGAFQLELAADDGFGGVANQQFQVQVFASYPNRPPIFQSAPQTLVAAGANYVYQPIVNDADADTLQFFLDAYPSGMSINSATGRIDFPNATTGTNQVTIRAEDGQGGRATQSYVLSVGTGFPSGATQIVSTPPVLGVVGELYLYLPHVVDPAASTFLFTLPQSPLGMTINSATGEIRWTPAAGQTGPATVTLQADDQLGGVAVQRFAIDVAALAPNQPPVFDATPPRYATEGTQFVYLPAAHDPEGQALSFVLDEGPAGATFSTQTGQLTWTPAHSDLGFHRIRLRALDPQSAAAEQTFFVEVRPPNFAPQITSPLVTSTIAGAAYRDLVTATDADDAFTFSLLAGPSGMFIDRRSGLLFWRSTPQDAGDHTVTLRVTDDRGAFTDRTFTLTATADDEKPVAYVKLSEEVIDLATTPFIEVSAGATDNVAVATLALSQDGNPITLTSGHATFTPPHPGLYTFVTTATDAAGNIGTATHTLRVLDPSDTTPPVISVTSPSPGAIITYLTDVLGSVSDANLEFYRLQVAPAGTEEWTTFFERQTAGTAGVLGTFDPTLLQRDIYDLRVLAQDVNGQQTTVTLPLSIEAQAVLGNFTLQFTDLSIPLAGIPIEILRTYDTLDASRSGDFGYGWRLGFREPRIHETVRVSAAEQAGAPALFSANPFREGTRVYLTNPDGRRVGFTFAPTAEPGFLGTIWHPHFVADPGVFDTLSVQDIPLSQRPDGTFTIYLAGFPYNPSEYFLTTKDQLTYHYDQFAGLLDVHDRNNVKLTFTDGGISSSAGQSIQFQRDAQGRITQIIDPAGHPLTYIYDAAGDLTTFQDQVGNLTSFTYRTDPSHYLDTVIDPLGRPATRIDYDADGRQVATTDALDHTSTRQYDVADFTEVVGDALGHEGTLIYDDRGNIVAMTDPRGGQTAMVYDENDMPVSVLDARGFTTAFAYDERGNLTRITDPLSHTMEYTYNAANQVVTTTDPLDRETLATYDAHGNLTAFQNADGVVTSMTFDASGRQTSYTNGNNEATTFAFATPANAQPTTIAFADGAERHLEYNALGQVTRSVNENGAELLFTYDGAGRMLSLTDGEGNLTTLTYVGQQVASLEDPLHRVTQFQYDDAGRLVKEIGPGDHVHQSEYNALNQLVGEIDALGRERTYTYDEVGNLISFHINPTWNYEYDLRGNLTKVTDGNGHATRYEYDPANRLVKQFDAMGGEQNFSYDAAGNLLTSSDANGHTTAYTYDNMNRTLTQTDPLDRTFSWTYDFAGNTTSFTDTNQHTTQYAYDTRRTASLETEMSFLAHYHSRLVEVVDALGGSTRYQYDGVGNVTRVTDPLDHATDYIYDGRNMLKSMTDALGDEFTYGYDAFGNLTSFTDALNHTTTYAYDDHNHLESATDPLAGLTSFVIDPEGNVTSQTDALNHTTAYTYDALDRLKTETDPLGGITLYEYDNADNVLAITDPLGKRTTHEYDALNRLLKTTDPLGHASNFTYDAVGNRLSQSDPLTRQVLFDYDNADQLTSITDVDGRVQHYSYDGEGNLLSASDPAGNTRHYAYDAANQLLEETDPLGHSIHYAYDLAGNLTGLTDRNGRERAFSYDALDRQTKERWLAGGATVRTISYAYDAMDNLLSVSDPDASYQFTYDARNRLASTDNLGTPELPHIVLEYGYDAVDNPISIRDNLGVEVTSTYNANNWLASRSWSGPGLDPIKADFSYNARGGLIGIQRYAGQIPQLVSQSTLTFDDAGRMTQLVHSDAGAQPQVTYTYAYDIADQLISETHHGQTTTYQYDDVGQLVGATHTGQPNEQYAYDASGNRTGSGQVIGPANQVLSDGTFNYSYDLEGNLLSKTSIATGNVTTFTYDYRNRLTAVEERTAGGTLVHSAEFKYDAFDLRIAQTVDGTTTTIAYCGDRIWADFDASGQVTARYLYGAEGADDLLARQRSGEGAVWYLTDHLFSVRDLANASGQIVDHVEYDSFGNVISETQPTVGDRFKFTGREYEATTGLYYYRSRFYDPALGRFLSEDSFGLAAGDDNFYRYVFNSPNNYTDPTGHMPAIEYALIAYDIVTMLIGPSVCLSNHGLELGLGYGVPYTDIHGVIPVRTIPGPGIPTPPSEWLNVEIISCADLKVAAWANGVFGEMATLLKFFNVMENGQPVDCVEFMSFLSTGGPSDHYLQVVADCNGGPNKVSAGHFEFNTTPTLLPIAEAFGFKKGPHENCFVAGTQVLIAPYAEAVIVGGAWGDWYANHRTILAIGILGLGAAASLAVARRKPKRDARDRTLDEFFATYEPENRSDDENNWQDSLSASELACEWSDEHQGGEWSCDEGNWQEESASAWSPSVTPANGALLVATKPLTDIAAPSRAPLSQRAPRVGSCPGVLSAWPRRSAAIAVFGLFLLLAAFVAWNPLGLGSRFEALSLSKNIEEVKPGDHVMAWDEETGEMVSRRVVRVFRNISDHVRVLTIQSADGKDIQEIKTTDGHPFRVPDRGWVQAGDLLVGEHLLDDEGQLCTVVSTASQPHQSGIAVFNFEVEGSHTYYVASHSDDDFVLVHNTSFERFGSAAEAESIRNSGGFTGKPGHRGNDVRIAPSGTVNIKTVQRNAARRQVEYSHRFEVDIPESTIAYLKAQGCTEAPGHRGSFQIPQGRVLKEFNRQLKAANRPITITKVARPNPGRRR